jgi:hypothetical protein
VVYQSKKCNCRNNKHKYHLIVDMKKEPAAYKNWKALRDFFPKKGKSYTTKKIKDQNDLDRLINNFN